MIHRDDIGFELQRAGLPGIGGTSVAAFSLPPRGPSDALRAIELRFDFDYTIPIDLRVSEGFSIVQTGQDTWRVDPAQGSDAEGFRVSWSQPYGGARIIDWKVAVGPRPSQDILERYREVIGHLPRGPENVDRARAQRFWLSFDLAASFEQIKDRVPEVAQELQIPQALWARLRPREVELLKGFLHMRARQRILLHAAGCDLRSCLPWSPDFQVLADGVSRLLLALLRLVFDPDGSGEFDEDLVWWAFLLFASGNLALPGGGQDMNIEPNSASIVCFAELADLSADPMRTSLDSSDDIRACARLRTIFVAGLEPYFETYRAARLRPRRADLYRRQNLRPLPGPGHPPPCPRNPRWERIRLTSMRDEYDQEAVLLGPDRFARWLDRRWSHILLEALRDEPDLRRVARPR